jgi:formaldehyde-activating enzyme
MIRASSDEGLFMLIGEGFAGDAPNGAHINLMLGAKSGRWARSTRWPRPRPGHVTFQVVLKLGVPVEPATLFIAKATLRNPATRP